MSAPRCGEAIDARLAEILAKAPASWSGTTYPNDSRYVGRVPFMTEMLRVLRGDFPITTEALAQFFPEDYVRLGSPYSTLLEVATALEKGFDPKKAFVFGSSTLPLIAVLLTSLKPVRIFSDAGAPAIVTEEQEELLKASYGCEFERCAGAPARAAGTLTVLVSNAAAASIDASVVDAVVQSGTLRTHIVTVTICANPSHTLCSPPLTSLLLTRDCTGGFLHILATDEIPPEDVPRGDGTKREGIHTIRKRLGAAPPTPEAIARLTGAAAAERPDVSEIKAHLKQLAGCASAPGNVLLSTVGLAALGSVRVALVLLADVNILCVRTLRGHLTCLPLTSSHDHSPHRSFLRSRRW